MKKFYFLFLFALIASIGNLYAVEKTVTFDFSTDPGVVSGIKNGEITVSFKTPGVAPVWKESNGGEIRAYAKNTITVSSAKKIKAIKFTFNKDDGNKITSTPTGFTSPTWTGESESVVFKIGGKSGHRKVKTIEVTYDAPVETKCATPTFNLENGKTYTDAQTLEITSTTTDATIHYTVNGGEEKIGRLAEFTENGKYTVDAWATKDGLTDSEHASITFTIAKKCAAPTFTPAAGFLKLGNAITFTSATADAEVYYQYSYNGGEYTSFVKGTSFTPDKEGTYKIIAKATKTGLEDGVSGEQIYEVGNLVFYESFDKNDGTGGNDGQWNGNIATSSIKYDVTGWTCPNASGANKCAKFGTSSKKGTATTPALTGLEGDAILTFKAAPWDDEGGKMTVTISNGTIEKSKFDLSNQTFTEYSVKISGGATSKITFTSENKRFFLDEVKVVAIVKEPIIVKEPTATLGFTAAEINEMPWLAANDIVLTEEVTEVKDASCVKLNCEEGAQIEYTLVSAETGSSTATVESGAEIVGLIKGEVYELTVCAVKGGYKSASRQYTFTITGSTSSVSSMSSEGVKVFAAEGGVKVVAEEATDVAVYTAAGQLVRQARVAEGSTLVNVAPGFYVVRANGTATKVIVR